MFCDLFIKTKQTNKTPNLGDETCFAMQPAFLMERYDDIFPQEMGYLRLLYWEIFDRVSPK